MVENTTTPLMETLLAEKDVVPPSPEKGDLLTGKVIEFGKNKLYLDLGMLGGGIIIGRELQDGLETMDDLNVGDKVQATVIEPETDEGFVELSLREAGHDKAWNEITRKLDEKETVSVKILEANKGGLIVRIHGVIGFLPVSQLTTKHYPRVENGDKNRILSILQGYVGQSFDVRIITADMDENKMIVSEKAVEAEEMQRRIDALSIGDQIEGVVSGVVDFGAFVKFNDDMEGLVHISELAWQRIENPRDIVKVGQKVSCKIIGLERDRISLSMKALEEDPWIQHSKKYKVGSKVEGEVTKLNPFGAFVQLDPHIHGLAHVSEFPEGVDIESKLKVGETYTFIVLSLEPKEHRLGLILESLYDQKKKEDEKKKAEKDAKTKKAGDTDAAKKEESAVAEDKDDKKDRKDAKSEEAESKGDDGDSAETKEESKE